MQLAARAAVRTEPYVGFGAGELARVRENFERNMPDLVLSDHDWARFGFALELMAGNTVIDIGAGHGVMVNSLVETRRFRSVSAFDIRTHSQAILHEDVTYHQGSIADPALDLPRHDTVVCMEVIEHLEEKHNEVMLANLRKLAKRRLVVTVPFDEPEPLWWHDRPGGHRQKFTKQKLSALFPNAVAAFQPRAGVDWIFVVEDKRVQVDGFHILPKPDLKTLLGA